MALLVDTFEGVPGGMNLGLPQQELDDTECRYLQDGLVDYPGLVRRRGPVRKVSGIAALPRMGTGLCMTLNPQGVDKYGVLCGDGANGYFAVLSDNLATVNAELTWPHPLPTTAGVAATTTRIVDAKPGLQGGLMIGVSNSYDSNTPNQALAYWLGGNVANAAGLSITVARGSVNVTGTGFSVLTAGMFLFSNTDATASVQDAYTSAYVGIIRSVNSATSLTLAQPSPYLITAKTGSAQSLRGFAPKVVKGKVTCDTNSTIVTGGSTKFISQGLGVGTWNLYRQSDLAWIGQVKSVASETSLTLGVASIAVNAGIAMANDAYVALRADADFSMVTTTNVNKVGWITATYADRQWYANNGAQYEKTSRVWFSDANDPENLDISTFDGDWVDVTSSSTVNEPIRGMQAANNGLLVFKENETFLLTGSSPASFAVRKLEDDGALHTMSIQPYGGGVIWAGREGVHFYDGVNINNLVAAKLGDYWKNLIRTFDPTKYRMWSSINRDHYLLYLENVAPSVAVIKGSFPNTPSHMTLAINMATGAMSVMTNLSIHGSVTLPASASKSVWYLVNGRASGDSGNHAFICDGEALFNEEGIDPIDCDATAPYLGVGPDFFLETKKFYEGDSLRLKRFKQLAMHYLVQGGNIKLDAVLGLNNNGVTLSSVFPASVYTWDGLRVLEGTWDAVKGAFVTWDALVNGVYQPKRVRFLKRSQHISFRLYQSDRDAAGKTPTISRLRLGPYQLGYKLQRPGRV